MPSGVPLVLKAWGQETTVTNQSTIKRFTFLFSGDRWLVTCLGCLRTSEGLLYRVVPADQGFDPGPSGTRSNGRRVKAGSYAGIFRFRIW